MFKVAAVRSVTVTYTDMRTKSYHDREVTRPTPTASLTS